ncbi:Asp domain-containing protein [Rhizoctonia solani AG-1 IA]|uniref:Asp domain-containing protein n=1 Tax=Thanatephorus cucumeris (strain AG1-IA) TaxID=983506 RepID=L8WX52_THACA|nr:Asp domain-containing protein [Rhizoctonia solani AG-1 IA]
MIATTFVPVVFLVVSAAGAATQNGVFELPIGFGQATVDGIFDGQTMPLLLDTGSSDTFIASDKCTVCDAYNTFEIKPTTNISDKEFGTTVGEGSVSGPMAFLDTNLGGLVLPQQSIVACGTLTKNILFLRRQSRKASYETPGSGYHFRAGETRLAKLANLLWASGIDPDIPTESIHYFDTVNVTNYNYEGLPLTRQFWNANITSLRFNGQDIPLFGSLTEGLSIGLLDTGASDVMCRPGSLDAIVAAINGTKHSNGHDIFIECDKPQIMEFQFGDKWYPINPIDLITPGVTADYNGTTFCRASLGSWSRTGGDCIIGLPFFRNVYAVLDYVDSNFQPQPRVGLASTTNLEQALKEFPSKWQTRMA